MTINANQLRLQSGAGLGGFGTDSDELAVDPASTVTFSGAVWTFPADELLVTGDPTAANAVARKSYVDNIATGLSWIQPVAVLQLVGNATIATLNGLSPTAGDAYIATDAGTPTAGTSDALVAGSIAEFDGTSWKEIVQGSGGFVPANTRAILATQTALISPYTDTTHDGEVYSFDGTNNTGATTNEALDGYAALVNGNGGVFENCAHVFSGIVATGTWIQFSGAGQINAGDGLIKNGNTLDVELATGVSNTWQSASGLAFDTGQLYVFLRTAAPSASLVRALFADSNGLCLRVNSSFTEQTTDRLALAAGGVSAAELNASVAGAGIGGAAGTPLFLDRRFNTGTGLTGTGPHGGLLDVAPAMLDTVDAMNVWKNGVRLSQPSEVTRSAATLSFAVALVAGDVIDVEYWV